MKDRLKNIRLRLAKKLQDKDAQLSSIFLGRDILDYRQRDLTKKEDS